MLYIVATPIGNLQEITYRAVEILKSVDYIACEDTRTSKVLLDYYGIKNKLVAYHKFNEKEEALRIVHDLEKGKNIALISDAGTPGISDPGNVLVNVLKDRGLEYTVVSGPSALINAFVLSGFPTPFTFVGFLPDKPGKQREMLMSLKNYDSTLIFYVSPHSFEDNIKVMYEVFGDREFCVVREISKKFEEITFANLKGEYTGTIKGEFVVLIKPSDKKIDVDMPIDKCIEHYMAQGLNKNDAIKLVAKERNLKKNEVYKYTIKTDE
ncbi:MAG: 16S rRNA (cytidine(1402)-2'-O)-methyltransferase [Clostridia bacterium]|nr:16S rRNA (cytidine(1402)-2'-O)-methyltransferase [Clostridia bacterium]